MLDQIYNWLRLEFRTIEEQLTEEGKVDLDGKLWKLAQKIAASSWGKTIL